MYAEERQAEIASRARAAGRVEVSELAECFDVTAETIRRDLTALEQAGQLRRVHGGAILAEARAFEPALAVRETELLAEKELIAKAAIAELPNEGAIALDAGSTTHRLAQRIPSDRELTVITNGLPIALTLASRSNLTVHMIGGRVRARTMATVDDSAIEFLRNVFVDVAFLGTNGISLERGLTTPDRAEAAVKKALVKSARRTVVLADRTKFSGDHFAHFADLADVDVIVTDAAVDPRIVAEIQAAGPQVVLA